MIGFVEDMPVDWRPQWDEMQKDTKVAPKRKLRFNTVLLLQMLISSSGWESNVILFFLFR